MSQDWLKEVLYYKEISPLFFITVLIVAFVLGAIHALAPGHGKSLMAAYLIGAKARIRDAVMIGLVITISHIFSVMVIGFVALWLTNYFWSGSVNIWLSLFSGITITFIGVWLFVKRYKSWKRKSPEKQSVSDPLHHRNETGFKISGASSNHSHTPQGIIHSHSSPSPAVSSVDMHAHYYDHNHNHSHHHYNPHLSVWSNIALGISGGIVPCPKALVILLLAISLQKVLLGIVIISVFSLGLAAVLVSIGILVVKASPLLKGKFEDRRIQLLSVGGAVIIVAIGIFITLRTVVLL